jgi:hypothetical protein
MTSGSLAGNSKPLEDFKQHCEDLSKIDLKETQKVAAHLLKMSVDYYGDVRKQANRSFFSAIVAAAVGILFFVYVCQQVMTGNAHGVTIGAIAGGLIQVISGINFYLYSKTTRQFGGFHICLERTNRYLLAYSYCENLSVSAQDACRQKLIEIMANAPMLTLEQVGLTGTQHEPAGSPQVGVKHDPVEERSRAATQGN